MADGHHQPTCACDLANEVDDGGVEAEPVGGIPARHDDGVPTRSSSRAQPRAARA